MDLYRMSDMSTATFTLSKVEAITDFSSLIWNTRYSAYGDFQLEIVPSVWFRIYEFEQRALMISQSDSLMLLETIEPIRDPESGGYHLKVSGRSIEAFLLNRNTKDENNRENHFFENMFPSSIVQEIINDYCVDPITAGPVNVIPGLTVSLFTPPGQTQVSLSIERGNVYTIISDICNAYGLGFKIEARPHMNDMIFRVYKGDDHITPGPDYVEYSQDGGNLTNVTQITSNKNYKNHARVLGATAGVDVYSFNSSVEGLDRRTLLIDATDINSDGSLSLAEEEAALEERGLRTLFDINNRFLNVVDGESTQAHHYTLGDEVILKSPYTEDKIPVRIVEDIWSTDGITVHRYPTFKPL